ncbi:MAG: helix-turn-helix domain-containing protein [Rhodocyclaceae bacterium]
MCATPSSDIVPVPAADNTADRRDAEQRLGARLRALRSEREWTLERLSKASGLARSTLSKIENGLLSPTYDALLKLAEGLSVDIAELFVAPAAQMGSGRRSITRRGEGAPHATPWYAHEVLCTDLAHKQMMPFVSTVRARADTAGGDWSRHQGEEFVYVLEGEVELHTEFYQPVRLCAGDSFYLDSRMGHRVISTGAGDARVLWVSTRPASVPRDGPAPVLREEAHE